MFPEIGIVAQATRDQQRSSSTRVRTRGIGKLIGLVIAVVLGIGGWIASKLGGDD
ncbi:MAG: hypothetical protein WBD20_24135 [Pirellulaceae bacterium]